ncbi:hypothetical protein EX177_02765 [Listeria innocua]|nr:hypothetical protein [Listeria innocua]HAA0617226.1 hypothetical protein [Listeria innocua]
MSCVGAFFHYEAPWVDREKYNFIEEITKYTSVSQINKSIFDLFIYEMPSCSRRNDGPVSLIKLKNTKIHVQS